MALPRPEIDEAADRIVAELQALATDKAPSLRTARRRVSAELKSLEGEDVVAICIGLIGRVPRWFPCEIVGESKPALAALDITSVEALGRGLSSWYDTDGFGIPVSGAAWLRGAISDDDVRRWAASADLWWRRTALVSTVVLNSKSRGGRGDTARTLDIATRLVDDREDMVVKAMSWALRTLVPWDAAAVRGFLADYQSRLAARAARETRTKLETGRKNRKPAATGT
jgi:hypothetical protein